jgi:hypothetical protein
MANWKIFSKEEIETLRANPYVKSVTENMVRFTTEFKEEFWRRYYNECQSPRKIVEELGLDPEVLGRKRIDGIAMHIKEQAEKEDGFRENRKMPKTEITTQNKTFSPSKAISKMQHKIAYMEQELEFIKKIILADREATQKG